MKLKARLNKPKARLSSFITLWSFLLFLPITATESAITYMFSGGRFGDSIMIYCKAKYCSLLTGFPLLYKPFPGSEHLALHKQEKLFSEMTSNQFNTVTMVSSADLLEPVIKRSSYFDQLDIRPEEPCDYAVEGAALQLSMNFWPSTIINDQPRTTAIDKGTLFITDLFTMLRGQQPTNPALEIIPIPLWMNFWPDEIYCMMQQNGEYRDTIKKMLTISHTTPQLSVPPGTISVAIHIRKGGHWDLPLSSPQWYDSTWVEHYYSTHNSHTLEKKSIFRCSEQYYSDQLNLLTSSLAEHELSIVLLTESDALHLRKGDGWDILIENQEYYDIEPYELYKTSNAHPRASDKKFPLRFPPEQFYGDQLNLLASTLADRELSVILFTDDTNPQALLHRFKQYCTSPTIHFLGISSSRHFIDDLTLMAQADCLIRPCSHFSGTAQLMGNHKIIISPTASAWKGNVLVITESNIVINNGITNSNVKISNEFTNDLKGSINNIFN